MRIAGIVEGIGLDSGGVGAMDLLEGLGESEPDLVDEDLSLEWSQTESEMEDVLEKKYADCISMCRPFIREPFIVKKIKEGNAEAVTCVSCNRCLAAVTHNIPVQCYNKGLPES